MGVNNALGGKSSGAPMDSLIDAPSRDSVLAPVDQPTSDISGNDNVIIQLVPRQSQLGVQGSVPSIAPLLSSSDNDVPTPHLRGTARDLSLRVNGSLEGVRNASGSQSSNPRRTVSPNLPSFNSFRRGRLERINSTIVSPFWIVFDWLRRSFPTSFTPSKQYLRRRKSSRKPQNFQ